MIFKFFRRPQQRQGFRSLNDLANEAAYRGDMARDGGSWASALPHYRQAVELAPSLEAIWVQRGHAAKEVGELAEAEMAYRCSLGLNPLHSDTHLQLGHLLKIQGRHQEAVFSYARAADLDSASTDAQIELANLARKTDLRAALLQYDEDINAEELSSCLLPGEVRVLVETDAEGREGISDGAVRVDASAAWHANGIQLGIEPVEITMNCRRSFGSRQRIYLLAISDGAFEVTLWPVLEHQVREERQHFRLSGRVSSWISCVANIDTQDKVKIGLSARSLDASVCVDRTGVAVAALTVFSDTFDHVISELIEELANGKFQELRKIVYRARRRYLVESYRLNKN